MNELIRLEQVNGKDTVNARDLHEFLENKRQFADWIKQRIDQYGFEPEKDFMAISQNCENGGKKNEYFLSLEMAKELSMVESNEKGKTARKYFIECEKKVKTFEIPKTYSQALLLAAKQAEKIEEQEIKLLEQKPKVEFYDQIIDSKTAINMQEVAGVINIQGLGRNNLFKFLREQEILNFRNIPYRKYIETGYFTVKERSVMIRGVEEVKIVTLVNQKGVDFIRKKIEENFKKEV